MKKVMLSTIVFLVVISLCSGQEIGVVKNGNFAVSLHRTNNQFAIDYSDVTVGQFAPKKSFVFPNKETVYNIVIKGFDTSQEHDVFVEMNKFAVVRFRFRKINGQMRVSIIHNNLANQYLGQSAYFRKDQIVELFGKTKNTNI